MIATLLIGVMFTSSPMAEATSHCYSASKDSGIDNLNNLGSQANVIPNLTSTYDTFVDIRGHQILDTCLPYSEHVNTQFTIVNKSTGLPTYSSPCAQVLGWDKYTCETQASLVDTRQYGFCSDPRYANWLVNEYYQYPYGTFSYVPSTIRNPVFP